jgi:16S rRNA (cytosine967-C5)-methyltransferase
LAIVLVKSKEISPARVAAFNILQQVENGAFSSVLLALEEPQLQPLDRSLCHELVLGVLRWQLFLDKILEHFSKRRVESLDAAVRIALRLGLYQLRFLTRVPASAAVNESVSLVRAARLSSATAFVNAVLRRAVREPQYDPAAEISDPLEKIAVQTSHPFWLIERWANQFGLEEAEAFSRANNTAPPTAFRVVGFRAKQSDVLSKLSAAGAVLKSSDIVKEAWRVSGATSLLREMSAAGEVYLQDEASQLAADALEVSNGDWVLDLCAAPGGKTTLMAERAGGYAGIVAADRSATRLGTVMATTLLHMFENIDPVQLDATEQLPFAPGIFNKVLVDAPCSGTGTLRANPEIRWRLVPSDFADLAQQQKRILSRAVDVLQPGGRLVYSTCSVEREENEGVIEAIDLKVLKTLRTWPQREGTDGFFISILEK